MPKSHCSTLEKNPWLRGNGPNDHKNIPLQHLAESLARETPNPPRRTRLIYRKKRSQLTGCESGECVIDHKHISVYTPEVSDPFNQSLHFAVEYWLQFSNARHGEVTT